MKRPNKDFGRLPIRIMSREEYAKLRNREDFWELYPNATGKFEEDRELSFYGEFEIEL